MSMKHQHPAKRSLTSRRKRFVALARVSSREQAREGFSLDVQVEALERYAERSQGDIVQMYRIAESASKSDERKTFKELIAYVKEHADEVDGLLFYKVDRAARNLFDYVELERLESQYEIPFISVSQPTDQTPAGRMQRRVLASMASFYTEQQSVDVTEGLARRVQVGLFVGMAPYGFRNVRKDGRSIVELHEDRAKNIRYLFELYAHQNCTIDMICERLAHEGIKYTDAQPAWTRSKVHKMLRDRAYLGEISYRGQWLPGVHPPIIDRVVWDRVQVLLGEKSYKSHELTYAGELIRCAHCGHPITGECVVKKGTGKEYIYYRCARYNVKGHPRIRLSESKLDEQVLSLLARLKQPEPVRDWFSKMLRAWIRTNSSNRARPRMMFSVSSHNCERSRTDC
jgi:DNA invertase Pin-like site-specific DNA recombinase